MPVLRYTKLFALALPLLLSAACRSQGIPPDLSMDFGPLVDDAASLDAQQRAYVAWRRNYKRIHSARDMERRATTTEDQRTADLHSKRIEQLLRAVLTDPEAPEDLRAVAQKMLNRPSGKTHSAPSGEVRRRTEWGALPPNLSRLVRVGGLWEKITVHHSDEVGGLVFGGTFDQSCDAVRSIQRQHLDGKRWGDIGYHYLIDGRGRVFEGRSLKWQGAHAGIARATGVNNNIRNLGICLLGNFEKSGPSTQASESLRDLLGDLGRRHGISRQEIFLHSDFSNTACPGSQLAQVVKDYRSGR